MKKKSFLYIAEQELKEVAGLLAETIAEKKSQHAVVVALKGDLGTGKTTFTKAFIRALGSKGRVLSPTFVLMKRYNIKQKHHEQVYHFDCYRTENVEELTVLGWEDIVKNPKHIVLIEWPTRITKILPKKRIVVELQHDTLTTRNCKIVFYD